jgi:hypothetical protein
MPWVPALVLLNDRLAGKIDLPDLERRISEIELCRRAATDLPHADLPDTGITEGESLLDRTHHDDPVCAIGERDCRRCESTEPITATVPVALCAPSRRLWMAMSG